MVAIVPPTGSASQTNRFGELLTLLNLRTTGNRECGSGDVKTFKPKEITPRHSQQINRSQPIRECPQSLHVEI
jgi:hypothetical protein